MLLLLTLSIAALAQDSALKQYQSGSKAFAERRFDDAIVSLTRSLQMQPGQLRVLRLLGLSYQLNKQLDKAESTFSEACRVAPEDAESWFYLGRVYYLQNFFDKALPALQKAAKLSPNDVRIHECLALTFEATGDPSAAEREYQQAQRFAGPHNSTVYVNYGALLLKRNRIAESEQLLNKAVALLPSTWQAHFELARLYYQTARWDKALAELTSALQCNPNPEETARTHGLLSIVYSRLGRHEDAERSAAAAEK